MAKAAHRTVFAGTVPARRVRRHRVLVAGLCVLASIIGFAASFAVWVNRQALDAGNWTTVSGEVLASPPVQKALGAYLVDQLFTSVDVARGLEAGLPKQAQGLARPAAAGLRALADREVPRLLATTQVREAWRRANHAAIEELLRIIDGGGRMVATHNGVVTLNVHELIVALASRVALRSQIEAIQAKAAGAAGAAAKAAAEQKLGVTLSADTGRLVVMRSTQLRTAQNIVSGIRGLAILLPLMSVALFALAVWLAEGWRRIAIRRVGSSMFAVGAVLLIARHVAGEQVVDSLVKGSANRPAGLAVWSIGTSLLRDLAIAVGACGLLLVAGAWLSGRARWRRARAFAA
jgi:hypothetical protein